MTGAKLLSGMKYTVTHFLFAGSSTSTKPVELTRSRFCQTGVPPKNSEAIFTRAYSVTMTFVIASSSVYNPERHRLTAGAPYAGYHQHTQRQNGDQCDPQLCRPWCWLCSVDVHALIPVISFWLSAPRKTEWLLLKHARL
jgi:hypothetical protein